MEGVALSCTDHAVVTWRDFCDPVAWKISKVEALGNGAL